MIPDYDRVYLTPPDEEDQGIIVNDFHNEGKEFYANTNKGDIAIDIDELVHAAMDEDDRVVSVSGGGEELIIESTQAKYGFKIYADNDGIYAFVGGKWEKL